MSNENLQEILTQAVEQVKKQRGKIVLTEIAKLTPFTVRQLGRLFGSGIIQPPGSIQPVANNHVPEWPLIAIYSFIVMRVTLLIIPNARKVRGIIRLVHGGLLWVYSEIS